MSKQHTPEPWMIDEANPELVVVLGEDGAYEYICDCQPYSFSKTCRTDDEIEANARRIVACINACRGISTETLERDGLNFILDAFDDAIGNALQRVQALREAEGRQA